MTFEIGQQVQHNINDKIGVVLAGGDGTFLVDFGEVPPFPKATSEKYLKPIPTKKKKVALLEWKDPLTGEEHTCPKHYIAGILSTMGVGASNAITATAILEAMGEKTIESNKRHLRQASLYLRQNGVHVISVRSSMGGYFIAETPEEVVAYTDFQRKLATSMIQEANQLDAVTVGQSLSKFNGLKCL